MHPLAYLVSFCLLLCYANADVSEILPVANHNQPQEIQTCLVLTTNVQPDPEANTVLPEQGPVPASSSLVEQDVEVATEAEETRSGQLDSSHADYQGPYHYEKPQVPLEYGVPLPSTDAPALPPPEGRNDDFQGEDYLPPLLGSEDVRRVKRHARLFGKRSL
ncbi:uncharacterized protein LOC110678569 [Aedes aegypti]|uniref:Uncharacterized protein n=1 Tax=Aedes aegypti TaxID=7159 RepID=A0A6I8U6B2_AEDAE|nr:uncharacterized protein LOC110678569 [Aedes aegypti]